MAEPHVCRYAKQPGFTLIEVLVALAFLAIAMAAIMGAATRYTDNAAYLHDKTLATWVAHNRLARFVLAPTWPDTGDSDGDTDMGGEHWYWHAHVSATPDPLLRRIDVDVSTDQDGTPVVSLSGFMANPQGQHAAGIIAR